MNSAPPGKGGIRITEKQIGKPCSVFELLITQRHKTELQEAYSADLLCYKDPVYLKVVKKHWSSLIQDCVAFEVSMIIWLYTVGDSIVMVKPKYA